MEMVVLDARHPARGRPRAGRVRPPGWAAELNALFSLATFVAASALTASVIGDGSLFALSRRSSTSTRSTWC